MGIVYELISTLQACQQRVIQLLTDSMVLNSICDCRLIHVSVSAVLVCPLSYHWLATDSQVRYSGPTVDALFISQQMTCDSSLTRGGIFGSMVCWCTSPHHLHAVNHGACLRVLGVFQFSTHILAAIVPRSSKLLDRQQLLRRGMGARCQQRIGSARAVSSNCDRPVVQSLR